MAERREYRHARLGTAHRLRDADERTAIAIYRPPTQSCNRTAHRQHGDPARGRRRADAVEEALALEDRVDAVAVRDVLDGVQQGREREAGESGGNSSERNDGQPA